MKCYGFTFMRNVEQFDYPFVEMLTSLSGLVDKIYLALGDSTDGTEDEIRKFNNIEIIRTVWDEKLIGDGGKIFSEQANIALDALRKAHGHEQDAWAIFLHCDEIIHPKEYDELKENIEYAKDNNYDAVKLRFLHFWKDHYHIAICKRWHPAEIRAFKLNTDIYCYGDAQGFRGATKEFCSDVSILHYGHVRDPKQHDAKQREILRRIRPAEKFKKYYNREKKIFAKTKTLPILIDHPHFMKDRIERLRDHFFLPPSEIIYIVGSGSAYKDSIKNKINAKEIHWVKSIKDVPFRFRNKNMIIINDHRLIKLRYRSHVPSQMHSPQALAWNPEMMLLLKLSEKGISLKPKK
ncbi:MAG: hypothetical protein A2381_03530 [Bdellovibrionales bacterium RIFOXYB1_FULL_37_110]|nr:MAG: hypothetical protein A2181_06265 [Bdellovibrionales bacterium RIFOXYA1_FULL_38_20]OFZ48476.1 MAG: hypothetical protein A2417_04020 [Bdellovibrionales bacterium RIFOXYC1_FULL_37_79]OFZ57997.1 MAG: hypothetical protein A2381_03530 [Bdellovibrionales bacterium RIFOXYB1_FULL_37_110]OFZ63134.1 MAG: hypothetical protein A2577_15660 [Bdellovibrionales bacterium RIFOXYD1_FULL_36_51]OFZ72302.1 MAG: hypothetical protein A2451_05145 [Bdellovibrionales bacterium RIFOXYC2_FULL_39_8]